MVTRREVIGVLAGVPSVLSAWAAPVRAADDSRNRLGVCTHSYGAHWSAARAKNPKAAFHDPTTFLTYCHSLGAGGVQVSLGRQPTADAAKVRAAADARTMYVEGIVSLPKQPADLDRFDAEVRTAKECGADVVRAAILSGRRYETFATDAAFRQFAAGAKQSLELAEPVLRKHRVRVGVENHKDWRVPELLDLLKRLSSEFVGVCLDTGNSIALLEDPHAVVAAYAPWTATTHFKDMGVAEYPDGFLLSEVPLGAGFLDLPKIVGLLRRAVPGVRFNLEMMTRDPLKVPCLKDKYWATFENVPGRDLARALALVRGNVPKQPLPVVTGLSTDDRLRREDDNVRACFAHAREKLGL